MKRYLLFIIIGAILLGNTSSQAVGVPGSLGEDGGANSNPHNLSSLATSNAVRALDTPSQTFPGKETQICIFCHTPHGATPQSTLWNRLAPDGSFLTRPDLDPGISNSSIIDTTLYDDTSGDYPNGASKLCLSCHDGVTAIGILASGDSIDMTFANLDTRASEIDLTTSHPISFVYNTDVRDYLNGVTSPVDSYQLTAGAYLEKDSLDRTWVQCTICHQPHQNTRGTNGFPFWREESIPYTDDYDTVCQACHIGTPAIADEHIFP